MRNETPVTTSCYGCGATVQFDVPDDALDVVVVCGECGAPWCIDCCDSNLPGCKGHARKAPPR